MKLDQLKKLFQTAISDIKRNRSMSITIVSNITLSYLILTIFVTAAYGSFTFIRFIETRKHMEIFFTPGTAEEVIFDFRDQIESQNTVDFANYVSQKEAEEFLLQKYADNPLILESIEQSKLPPSLEIRAKNIDDLPGIASFVESIDPDLEHIFKIAYNEETTNVLSDLLFWIQLFGAFILVFIISTIFYLSLLAVEISMKSRKDELEIMELVGGGRWYIRLPFIFQGLIYGFVGAVTSTIILAIFIGIFTIMKDQSPTLSFFTTFFSEIDWPDVNIFLIILLVFLKIFLGTILGGINSFIAVARRMM